MGMHTDGPWRFWGEIGSIHGPDGLPIMTAGKDCKSDDGEGYANARLIAAAPQMLELLKLFTESGNFINVDTDTPEVWPAGKVFICRLVDDPFQKAQELLARIKATHA